MKICIECQKSLDLNYFYKTKEVCKTCYKKQYSKKYYQENAAEILQRRKQYYKENVESLIYKAKKYQQKNAAEIKQLKKQYYQKNATRIRQRNKQYYRENTVESLQRQKQYYKENTDKIIKRAMEYEKNRRKIDPLYKFRLNTRKIIYNSFKRVRKNNFNKQKKTEELLGCTILEFKAYIESQFKPGMTLDNQGQWHMDHIIPLATAKTEDDIIRLSHYTNFQPLWAEENLKKGSRY